MGTLIPLFWTAGVVSSGIYFIDNSELLVRWSINEMSRVGNRYIYNTWNLNDSWGHCQVLQVHSIAFSSAYCNALSLLWSEEAVI